MSRLRLQHAWHVFRQLACGSPTSTGPLRRESASETSPYLEGPRADKATPPQRPRPVLAWARPRRLPLGRVVHHALGQIWTGPLPGLSPHPSHPSPPRSLKPPHRSQNAPTGPARVRLQRGSAVSASLLRRQGLADGARPSRVPAPDGSGHLRLPPTDGGGRASPCKPCKPLRALLLRAF